jgi:hypothetical protein
MRVSHLQDDAAAIYGLTARDLVLVLFGMNPHTLPPLGRISDPPPVTPGSTVLIFNIAGLSTGAPYPFRPIPTGQPPVPLQGLVPPPNLNVSSKLLANFRLAKFDGATRNWKQWDKSFVRFLSIHQLDQVIEENFLSILPLSPQDFLSNKMVYYLLEDAIVAGSLAAKYFRQAAKWNGNEAYMRLHDGYVFSGPQTMALLLAELVNIRFKSDESASGFCLRLREIFEELEMVPGQSSVTMNDTQKIGYLLSGLRQETQLQSVYVALQDKQLRGAITFEDACIDLHHRCEAIRADELLTMSVRGQPRGQNQKALVSTEGKRQNKTTSIIEMKPCLQKDCEDLVKMYLPLCPLHYHQCISGKCAEVELKDGLGTAKFNAKTQVIDYPPSVPKDRFPLPRAARPTATRKALVFQGETTMIPPTGNEPVVPILMSSGNNEDIMSVTFYIDSGAGQCLCSCASAFITMEACHLQVVGVAGRLTIHGQGTAVFIASVHGHEVLLRIHNCLHSFGKFNLISVSQLKMVHGNSLNFSVDNPFLKFSVAQ